MKLGTSTWMGMQVSIAATSDTVRLPGLPVRRESDRTHSLKAENLPRSVI